MAAASRTKPSTPRLSEAARHVVIPEGIVTTGWPAVEAKGAELGITYDAWQQGAGRIALGKRADGKYAATVGGITWSIPRQVGKTFLVGSLLVILCVLFPGLTVLWTAHRTRTATKTFQSMQGMCRRKKVAPHVLHFRTANGEQEIRFRNGSVIMFGAREQGFGRGFDQVDVEVFDEAQILTEKALADMVPATNQARHPHGALLFFIGTPPLPTDPGEVFAGRRARALAGKAPNGSYVEFSADEDADLDDHAQWRKANPSFPSRTPLESMLRMRENLGSDEAWKREALGIWDKVETTASVIPPDTWSDLKAKTPPAGNLPPTALAVDMSHDRVTAIAGCWTADDTHHVELLAVDIASDTLAVVEWLGDRAGRKIPVVIDSLSPAASLVPALKSKRVQVIVTSATDMQKACGGFYDDAMASRLTHAGQPQLTDALMGARKRAIGTAGGWGWDRKDPSQNIAPIVSATLARYGATVNTKTKTGRVVTA